MYTQAANIQFIEYLEDDSVEIIVATQLEEMSIDESSIDYLDSFLTGTTSTASSLLDITLSSEAWPCLVCEEEIVTTTAIKCSKCSLFIHYNCNDGGVTNYYKKNSKNLNVTFVNNLTFTK